MWENSVVTDVGKALLATWVSGTTFNLDSAKGGTGIVTPINLKNQTGLVDQKQTLSLLGFEPTTGGIRVKVRVVAHPTAGYTLNQIGLWGSVDGGATTLIALYQDATGISIPAAADIPDFVYTFFATIQMANDGTLTITVDTSALVSMSDLTAALASKLDVTGADTALTVAFTAAEARTNIGTGETLAVLFGKLAKWYADFKTVVFSGSYNDLSDKPTIPTQLAQLSGDSTHRTVTDTEKSTWNGKQDALSGDVSGHYHTADRNRANHTGSQLAATISDFAATVRTTILTGLDTSINAAIVAGDSILAAFGKLQAQFNAAKSKLDGIESGAQVNTVTSVVGRTGAVTLAPSDITGLISSGKIDENLLPALAVTDTYEVASEAAMLGLSCQKGDIAVRSDVNKCFILKQLPANTLSNWVELRTPTDAVLSVAGKTGAVTLGTGDITGLDTALAGKAPLASPALTGNPTAPTQSSDNDSTRIATTAFVQAIKLALETLIGQRETPSGAQAKADAAQAAAEATAASALDAHKTDIVTVLAPNKILKADANGNMNFNGKQALALVIETRTSDPASPAVGQIWFRTDV